MFVISAHKEKAGLNFYNLTNSFMAELNSLFKQFVDKEHHRLD